MQSLLIFSLSGHIKSFSWPTSVQCGLRFAYFLFLLLANHSSLTLSSPTGLLASSWTNLFPSSDLYTCSSLCLNHFPLSLHSIYHCLHAILSLNETISERPLVTDTPSNITALPFPPPETVTLHLIIPSIFQSSRYLTIFELPLFIGLLVYCLCVHTHTERCKWTHRPCTSPTPLTFILAVPKTSLV